MSENYDFSSLIGDDCSILEQLDENTPIGDLTKQLACQLNLLQVALLNSVTPAGKLCWHIGCRTKIGKDFIIADGSYYNPTTYPELFESIGYKYGSRTETDGTKCFRAPDLRNTYVKGMDLSSNRAEDIADYKGFDNEGAVVYGDHVGAKKEYCEKEFSEECDVKEVMLALPLISTGQICI